MRNCRNCGAPVTSNICDYCGTRTGINASGVEVLVEEEYLEVFTLRGDKFRIPNGRNVTVNINDPVFGRW